VYLLALLLSVGSGLLFGAVPVQHVLRADPYEILKRGPRGTGERRMTSRDLLLVVQIAICALLVTSSLVAVRGLMRSLHGNFAVASPRRDRALRRDPDPGAHRWRSCAGVGRGL
jgi:hypothetical protein